MDNKKTRTRKMGKLDHNHERAQTMNTNTKPMTRREQDVISRLRTGYTTHSAVMDKESSPKCWESRYLKLLQTGNILLVLVSEISFNLNPSKFADFRIRH
jgi:hypothetical protein